MTLNSSYLYERIIKSDLCIQLDEEIKLNFINKKGVEIGGPSNFFKRNYPIYQIISQLDIDIPTFSYRNIPHSLKKIKITKPGSRFLIK